MYLIPGLATDERLFHRLNLPDIEMSVLKWEVFLPNDSMASYAKRMAAQIDDSEPFFLLGVSFGSMVAVEISKIKKPEKLFIISGAKGRNELPFFLRVLGNLPLYKLFPQKLLIKLSEAVKYFLGRLNDPDRHLLVKMLRDCPDKYLHGAIRCIANWKADARDIENIDTVHIQGSKDRVIPARNLKSYSCIEGGTHFMILNNAEEIAGLIKSRLE
jgi:pimeloyl-ACP methyl ester carboxylesterase